MTIENISFFLEEKFTKHIGGEPHSLFNVFDFQIWPNQGTDEFQNYGDEAIQTLITIYGPVLSDGEKDSLNPLC